MLFDFNVYREDIFLFFSKYIVLSISLLFLFKTILLEEIILSIYFSLSIINLYLFWVLIALTENSVNSFSVIFFKYPFNFIFVIIPPV